MTCKCFIPHHPLDRNVYQLLVSPVVLLGYSLVEAWAMMELGLRGRHICHHRPSNKAQLIPTLTCKPPMR